MDLKHKAYTVLLACMAAAIILLCVFIYIIWGGIRQGSADVVTQRQEVLSMQLADKQVGDFKAKYPLYQANLDNANGLFIDAGNPVDFIRFLENIASQANVILDI